MNNFKKLLSELKHIELGQREKDILNDLTTIQIDHEVPEWYLSFWLFDRHWYWFQATFRDWVLSITN